MWDFQESLSQGVLAGTILVGRLGAVPATLRLPGPILLLAQDQTTCSN